MVMARRRVDLRLPDELLDRLDAEAERLGQTRTKFVERALERVLGTTGPNSARLTGEEDARSESSSSRSASARAPAEVPLPKIAPRRTR